MSCTCGSDTSFEACCGPFLSGEALPETAEALMRSRYSAFVKGAIDYILDTHVPEGIEDLDRREIESWSRDSQWLGLEILSTEAGGPGDGTGKVEFVANYHRGGKDHRHHEIAVFQRRDGRWLFEDGVDAPGVTYRREAPKTHRNDPCPCGSGKKYKKCCGRG